MPLFAESEYATLVAEADNSDLLVQRTIDRYGHCEFEVEEMFMAFLDLVDWVETGVQPDP